jgi:hypothetical protein
MEMWGRGMIAWVGFEIKTGSVTGEICICRSMAITLDEYVWWS